MVLRIIHSFVWTLCRISIHLMLWFFFAVRLVVPNVVQISIHLMLWFFFTANPPFLPLLYFNTSNVMVLLMPHGIIAIQIIHFNTSNVMVLLAIWTSVDNQKRISIHLMLWFFSKQRTNKSQGEEFQYI